MTSAVATTAATARDTTDLLWNTLSGLFNTYEELDGARVMVFIESNCNIRAELLFENMAAWHTALCEYRIRTKYRCVGVVPFLSATTGNSGTPWHTGVDGTLVRSVVEAAAGRRMDGGGGSSSGRTRAPHKFQVGRPTTNESKVAGVARLRYALANHMLRFHKNFHTVPGPLHPDPHLAEEAIKTKMLQQLYAFAQTLSPSGAIQYSGKASNANDDLVMALTFFVTLAGAEGTDQYAHRT
jgi:hypothetical protein